MYKQVVFCSPSRSLCLSLHRLLDCALIKVAAWRGLFGLAGNEDAVFFATQKQEQPLLSHLDNNTIESALHET